MYTNLLMDFLEECNLFMKALDTSFQVQPGQSGSIYILQRAQQLWNNSVIVIHQIELLCIYMCMSFMLNPHVKQCKRGLNSGVSNHTLCVTKGNILIQNFTIN